MKKKIPDSHKNFELTGDLGRIIGESFESIDLGGHLGNFTSAVEKKLLLRRFNAGEIRELMNYIGLIEHLNSIGYRDLIIDTDYNESAISCLRVYSGERKPGNNLIDIRLSESKFKPDIKFFDTPAHQAVYDMVVIEWLSAQNPLAGTYEKNRPQLPGQAAPGLGVLKYLFDLLYVISKGIFNDGYMDVPDHIHGSIMYSKKFKFFDPEQEAMLRAVMRDLAGHPMSDISWGILTETIIDKNSGAPLKFLPSQQVFPVSDRINRYFSSKKYQGSFMKAFREKSYHLDTMSMEMKRSEILAKKDIRDL